MPFVDPCPYCGAHERDDGECLDEMDWPNAELRMLKHDLARVTAERDKLAEECRFMSAKIASMMRPMAKEIDAFASMPLEEVLREMETRESDHLKAVASARRERDNIKRDLAAVTMERDRLLAERPSGLKTEDGSDG